MTMSARAVTPSTTQVGGTHSAGRDSLLTFTLQPPELFDSNNITIEKVAFSKYFICCQGIGSEGQRTLRLYNQSGRLVAQAESLTGRVLAERMNSLTSGWWKAETLASMYAQSDFLLGNSNAVFRKILTSNIKAICDNDRTCITSKSSPSSAFAIDLGKRATGEYWSCPELVSSDASGRYLLFQWNGKPLVIDTHQENGKPADVTSFSLYVDPEKSGVHLPILPEYSVSPNGLALPNGNHLASHVNGILTITQASDLQRVHADACTGYSVDPTMVERLTYLNPTSRSIITVDLSKTTPANASTEEFSIPFQGEITDMKFDPVGNFLLFTVTDEGQDNERMVVVEKSSFQIAAEVPGIRGPITLDQVGTIYFVDKRGQLRLVNSNFKTIPVGGVTQIQEERRQRAAKRLEAASQIVLPELPEGVVLSPTANLEQIEDALPKTIQGRFKEEIAEVKSLDELDKLEARIGIVKDSVEYNDAPNAFSLVDSDIASRRHVLRANALSADATRLLGELQSSHTNLTVRALREVDAKIATLKKERLEIAIDDEGKRREIDRTIGEISKLRSIAYRVSIERAGEDLEKLKSEVTVCIAEAGSIEEVYGIIAGERYAGCQSLIRVLEDAEVRKSHRESLEKVVAARITELEKDANAEASKLAERKREAAESTAKILEKLTSAIGKVSSTAELTQVKSGALMAAVTKATMSLSDEDKDTVQATISGVLQRAAQKLQTRNQLAGITRGGGEVAIGAEKFPVAGEYSPIVKPTIHTDEGSGIERLAFEDGFGRLFLPPHSPLRPSAGTPEYDEWRERAMTEAVSHFRSLGRKVPELRPNWIITRHTVECLERIIRELHFQRESGQGILILEGEAGTGKNVLIDLLAHLSKHERFLFACNFQTQKEDFTYEYAFTPQKGTYRVSAKLLEKLVTPYAFNAFDEINTLPPGVLKMLNALLDERRTLYLPDGREVPVDSTSYLVGFMNPRHYIGTQELSAEIVSRATFMPIQYPPEKRKVNGKELYAPDEAIMLSRSVRGLSSLSLEEFEAAWDAIVNSAGGNPASITADQERLIQGLHTVVKVANAVRRQYTNFQTNKGTEQMDFVFCLRTGASIARRLRPESNVREIIKGVVLPKISSHESKTNAEMLITTT
jgi:hypothetical protein